MLADTFQKTTVSATVQDLRLVSSLFCKDETRLFSNEPFKVLAIGHCTLRSTPVKGGKHRLTVKAGTHLSDVIGSAPVYASAK